MTFRILFVSIFLIIFTQNIIGKTKVTISKEESVFNHHIKKILNSDKYHLYRSKAIKEELKNRDKFLTSKHLRNALNIFFETLAPKLGGDINKVIITPDMLLNKDNRIKLKKAFPYIDRDDLLDKLNVVNLLINHLKKVDDSSMFTKFVNQRYYITHNTDMAHHWLAYFLSKPEVNVNCYKKNSSTMEWIIYKNNYDAAKLIMRHGYKVTDFDFEVLREHIQVVSEDNEEIYDKEKALEALSKIENLMIENLDSK